MPKIKTQLVDLANPVLPSGAQFEVVFSNFGGLNCISGKQLNKLNLFLQKHISKNGSCILVIMPPKTFLEKWYRWYKNDIGQYQNRKSNFPLFVNVGDKQIATYYHSPKEIETAFTSFHCRQVMPIGFIPSYLNGNKLMSILSSLDQLICRTKMFSNYADHFLIHLQKRS